MSNAAMIFYNEMDKSDRVITYSMNKTRDSMKKSLSGFNLLYHTMEHNKNTLESIVNSPILGLVQKFIGPVNWIASKADKLCFDENTLLYLKNGKTEKISDIQVGEILIDDSIVIAKHKFQNSEPLYLYNTVYVSGSHIVYDKNDNEWKRVSDCGIITNYKPEYIYSISTSTSKIQLKDNLFRDYAESQSIGRNEDIDNYIIYYLNGQLNKYYIEETKYIQNHYNSRIEFPDKKESMNNESEKRIYIEQGLDENMSILVNNKGDTKLLKELSIGDRLNNNNIVIGKVELLTDVYNVYCCNGILGTSYIKLHMNNKWINIHNIEGVDKKDKYSGKLYHIMTNKGYIEIIDNNNRCIKVRDYSEFESSDLFTLISDLSIGYE